MVPIGIMLAWAGYTVGWWGYLLVKGYNVGFKQVASPFSFYTGPWPPACLTDAKLIPTGNPADNGPCSAATGTAVTGTGSPGTGAGGLPVGTGGTGKCPPGFVLQGGRCVALPSSRFGVG